MPRLALATLIRNLRWQDAVDVSLLTLVFSGAYLRLRRTITVRVAFGLLTLVAGSWIASHLGLILTSYLLSAVSAVATIVVVVVFQNEIRRGLSRVTPLQWLSRRRSGVAPDDSCGVIAEAVFAVAGRGKGALIVIPRRDPLAGLVTAGTVVDARLSAPLIEAIFTSTSSLHDGAIIISNNRVIRAAVVLPLETETEDPRRGTRHRAAMGLARASDALVICVSEERGSVSLAYDRKFEPMTNETSLRAALTRLGNANGTAPPLPGAMRASRVPAMIPHLAIFAGVVLAWAALALDRTHAVARVVPLEIRGVTDGLVFDPLRYTSVAVELRSSRRELELLPPDAIEAYIDLTGVSVGSNVLHVSTSAPAGIEVVSTTPASVPIVIRPQPAVAASSVARGGTVSPSQR